MKADCQALLTEIGRAIVLWQRVEFDHYLIAFKALGLPEKLCSAIYFTPGSFAGRRQLLINISREIMTAENVALLTTLNGRIGGLAEKRNTIAHFHLGFQMIGESKIEDVGSGTWQVTLAELGAPILQRHPGNSKRQDQEVTIADVKFLSDEFVAMSKDIRDFVKALPTPDSIAKLLRDRALGLHLDSPIINALNAL